MHTKQDNYLAGREPDEINNSGGRQVGEQFSSQTGQFTMGTGHLGTQAVTSHQIGYPEGHQYLTGQSGHLGTQSVVSHPSKEAAGQAGYPEGHQYSGAQPGQTGTAWQTAQPGMMQTGNPSVGGQAVQQGSQKFGALELIEAHEVLNDHIDGINQLELYRSHIKDQSLMQILDKQINHMYGNYQTLVNYLQNMGAGSVASYRAPKVTGIRYGLRQPQPMEPNANVNMMDDRDVASGMMGSTKASALLCTTAALECADPNLRNMITNCAVSSINQAYELFQFMNQKGMYQVPTLAEQTTQTMMHSYRAGSRPTFQ